MREICRDAIHKAAEEGNIEWFLVMHQWWNNQPLILLFGTWLSMLSFILAIYFTWLPEAVPNLRRPAWENFHLADLEVEGFDLNNYLTLSTL